MAKKAETYDILIVGAGFAGIYNLYRLRQLGLSVRLFEAAEDIGGVWHHNCYPGARVDVETPFYQYSLPEIWKTWTWTERFPAWPELRRYFQHVVKVLDLKKDITFHREIISGQFDPKTCRWTVKTRDGTTAQCKYLVNCVGTSFKRHLPDFKGIKSYKKPMFHSSFWPQEGVDVKGKDVGIIGSGASGLQIAQEWAKEAGHLTLFIRTPNLALPMFQSKLSEKEQIVRRGTYQLIYDYCRNTYTGLPYETCPIPRAQDEAPEARTKRMEEHWQRGGFNFSRGLWGNVLTDLEANRVVYDFWAEKTRARITDPVKKDILAPLEPPHPFGTKRASLEQDFYECMDQPNVTLVDLQKVSIEQFEETGIRTSDGVLHKFDAIALGTGYDAVTGGLVDMGLVDLDGVSLKDRWADGVSTYLGMTVPRFPNLFIAYGPQAPTAFTNGPIFIEVQCEWMYSFIKLMEEGDYKSFQPKEEAAAAWRKTVLDLNDRTLMPLTNSWYNGGNVPGKKREALNYLGGINKYRPEIDAALDMKNFELLGHDSKSGEDFVNKTGISPDIAIVP